MCRTPRRTAARTATVNGDEVYADYYILRTIRKEASAIGIDDLQRVVVYRADGFGNPPTTTCKNGTAYAGARGHPCRRLQRLHTRPTWPGRRPTSPCKNASQLDGPWCPTDRKVAESGPSGPPDYIGVYIKYTHDLITGLFKGQSTITDFVVIRMEPRKLS